MHLGKEMGFCHTTYFKVRDLLYVYSGIFKNKPYLILFSYLEHNVDAAYL